jgi:hypothetical protein
MERFPRGGSLLLDRFAQLLHVSTTVAAIMIAVVVLQLATQVFALVDLARRRAVRGGRKWVWAVAIAFGNLPGAIAYLAAGRISPDDDLSDGRSGASAAGSDAADRAVDALYGPRGKQ